MTARFADDSLNALLAAALRELPEPVVLYDDEHFLFANSVAQRILGASAAAQVEGARLDDFVSDFADVSAERRGYVFDRHMVLANVPLRICTLDGQVLRLRVDMRPLSLHETTVVMVTLAR